MKKRILPILLAAAVLMTAFSGCSVFNDLADEILGASAPMPTATLSETFDPVAAAAAAEAEAKAARPVYTADDIQDALRESLVQVVTYDMNGAEKNRGTGFFLPGGVVTSLDTLRGAFRADIVVYDGGVYEVQGVHFYDETMNLAVLACSKQNAPDLKESKWETETNEMVFALGINNAVSQGTLVADGVDVGGIGCVQTSAYLDSAVAGGPLVNVYGELLGVCTTNIADDGQSYAVRAATIAAQDLSQTMSLDDFRKAVGAAQTGDGTQVVTGDAGEKVYAQSSFVESEPNNSVAEATALQLGYWTGAYVNEEGNEYKGEEGELTEDGREKSAKQDIEDTLDVFSFTLESDGKIEVIAQPCYAQDVKQLDPTLVMNEDMDHLANDSGESIGFFKTDEVDGFSCQVATADVKAGTYYIAVKLLDDWSQDIGCYYKIKVNFTANDAQG